MATAVEAAAAMFNRAGDSAAPELDVEAFRYTRHPVSQLRNA